MEKAPYTPIACHVYDQLEIAAMKRRVVNFLLEEADGSRVSRKGFIDDLWAKDGVEYLKLHSGEIYRLDQLVEFEGGPLQGEEGLLGSCGCR